MSEQVIRIHRSAPPKPELGAPCNGCGVCCLVEPCPVSRFWLRCTTGPCPALTWSQDHNRYACGMMKTPSRYLGWMPRVMDRIAGRLFAGWLAAGEGCDSHSEEITDSEALKRPQ